MGETVSFASNGDQADGYFAAAKAGSGPGVLVIQEWWGLAPQLKRVVDRLANEEGFTALAPDLYRGELAEHTEMDKAAALMNSLPIDRAARDMAGAIDYLLASPAVTSATIGVIGFCMGGMLAMVIGAQQGDRIGGVATFYGAPLGDSAPDWTGLTAPVLGHFAMNDDFFPAGAVRELEKQLKDMGKDVSFEYIPDTGHAFANEDNPFGTHNPDAALKTWTHSVEWLHQQLG